MNQHLTLALGLIISASGLSTATEVFSNNPFPGDSYTNAGGSNQGQLLGTDGWTYNNVRNSGVVGVHDTLPYAGNGSAHFSLPGSTGKADIEFLGTPINLFGNFYASQALGSLSDLQNLSYMWYRDSGSSVFDHLHPVIRVLVDRDGDVTTPGDRGGLVFERAYNGGGPVPTDTWVADSVTSSTNLWSFGMSGYQADKYNITLADWLADATMSNAVIVGFSLGVGSGWNADDSPATFAGAVDQVSWTINGSTTTTNFEVIPEPTALALVGLGALTLLRRKRSAA